GVVMLTTGAVVDVTAETVDDLKKAGNVRIGVLVDYPPYGFTNEQGQPDGFDVDIAKLLAEAMGVKLDLVPVLGPNRVPYLSSNQVDIIVASLTITPERAERVDFSDPYATSE